MSQSEFTNTMLIGILVFALLGTPIAFAEKCDAVLPSYEISAATQDVPEPYQRFLGLWGNGKWDDKLCHKLIVESVDKDGNVSVVYSWGTYVGWGIRRPGYSRHNGTIKGDKMTLQTFGNGADVAYRYVDGTLHGEYKRKGTSRIVISPISQ